MKWASENGVQTLQNAGYPLYGPAVNNELNAYKTGFAYSRAYPVFGVVKLNGINEMNLFFIKDQNGNPVYSNLKTLEGKKK